MTPSRVYLGYMAVFTSLAMWGVSFPVGKYALQFMDVWSLLFYRIFLGTLIALPFVVRRYQPIKPEHRGALIVWGLTLIPICLTFQFTALMFTSASIASLAIALEFPFVLMWLFLLYKKRPNRLAFYITTLGLIGLALIIGEIKMDSIIGVLLIFGGGISFALGSVLSDKVAKHYDPVYTTAIAMLMGTAVMFIPWLVFGTTATVDIPLVAFGALIFLGVFNSFLATFLWTFGCRVITSTRAAQMIMVEPLVGAGVSIIWLNEYWYWGTVVGGAMVIGSIMMDSRMATSD